METVSTVGKGYYNYYNQSDRYSTTDGKAVTAWYDRDLATEEINSNNSGIKNKDSAGAEICRKVADQFQSIAESNRSKYHSVDEMKNAVWAKYSLGEQYKHLSNKEKTALARTEIEMTMFGTVHEGNAQIIHDIKSDYSKKKVTDSVSDKRTFNIQMLGKQICNVFRNNGISQSLFGNNRFKFSVNGMTNKISVELLNSDDKNSRSLLDEMEKALNTNDNAKQLFFNLLYDSNKQGLLPKDQLAKWKLYNEFQNISGLDIRSFNQTKEGFVDKDGRTAKEIYKESLKTTTKVPSEFKNDAYNYFTELEKEALKYNINDVKDIELSLVYQNGMVQLPRGNTTFDVSV